MFDGKLRNMASVYLLCGERILLLYRQGQSIVKDLWIGSAGGHFEEYELNDARHCVLRELHEELGLLPDAISHLQLRYVTLRYTDGELRQNYYFFAKLDSERTLPSSEGRTNWFSLSDVSDLPMPFTARWVIDHYIHTGMHTNLLYGGIADSNRVAFLPL